MSTSYSALTLTFHVSTFSCKSRNILDVSMYNNRDTYFITRAHVNPYFLIFMNIIESCIWILNIQTERYRYYLKKTSIFWFNFEEDFEGKVENIHFIDHKTNQLRSSTL